jgi:hypothetical protein
MPALALYQACLFAFVNLIVFVWQPLSRGYHQPIFLSFFASGSHDATSHVLNLFSSTLQALHARMVSNTRAANEHEAVQEALIQKLLSRVAELESENGGLVEYTQKLVSDLVIARTGDWSTHGLRGLDVNRPRPQHAVHWRPTILLLWIAKLSEVKSENDTESLAF